MRDLYFHAVAGHPKVAQPLMLQARNALGPFNRYLGQAIHTAKQRQIRYQLPWERVRNLQTIHIKPKDCILRFPCRRPGILLSDWPKGGLFDITQMAFIPERGVPVRMESAVEVEGGLLVYPDQKISDGESLIWCKISSTVCLQKSPEVPKKIMMENGVPLQLKGDPKLETDQQHWRVVVQGNWNDMELEVDGDFVWAERQAPYDGLKKVFDSEHNSFSVQNGVIRTEDIPAEGVLSGDDGIRYEWTCERNSRQGCWIQLLPPESSDSEETMDPRAAFCEGEVKELWTQPRRDQNSTLKVKKIDQDRYQILLDRYPSDGTILYLPLDLRNLYLQKRALQQLVNSPLPHHQGLLRLCEDPSKARWPSMRGNVLQKMDWKTLTDPSRSGTDEQRDFVQKALTTPDLAILEGPPGSGKTTAICEIVLQMLNKGQRVLLCASTHVAIDNVLERLLNTSDIVDAVRIGGLDKVDDNVHAVQLDERVESLFATWRRLGSMRSLGDGELRDMAKRTIIMAANLTCGTTMGIVSHPIFQDQDKSQQASQRPITTMPHWDVLIVDEASKTLIQEFMVPALMAKRWIIVGDVHQLPPFSDRADIVANLRDLVDENDKPIFPVEHQRACLLIYRMSRKAMQGLRWLFVESPKTLSFLTMELDKEPIPDLSVVRVVRHRTPNTQSTLYVTIQQITDGAPESLLLAAADWVLVGEDIIAEVADLLPVNLMIAKDLLDGNAKLPTNSSALFRQESWIRWRGKLQETYKDRDFQYESKKELVTTYSDAQACEQNWLLRHDLANEMAWRLTRLHELRHSHNDRETERIKKDLSKLHPFAVDISESVEEIEDIGLPSILEVLQEGIGADRSKRKSSLTMGLRKSNSAVFDSRFVSLSYQHRMHPEISAFSREIIYEKKALKDANTIQIRDQNTLWDFGDYPSRRTWVPIQGREQGGVNVDEIKMMETHLKGFVNWAKRKGPPINSSGLWEVACLCFYTKQERAISEMLQQATGDDRRTRFRFPDSPVEVVCGTVDRFQGREADLVLISLRNTRRVGFLDSPNRLNVALTRARQQLVIFGNHDYFVKCGIVELEELAKRTSLSASREQTHRRRISP